MKQRLACCWHYIQCDGTLLLSLDYTNQDQLGLKDKRSKCLIKKQNPSSVLHHTLMHCGLFVRMSEATGLSSADWWANRSSTLTRIVQKWTKEREGESERKGSWG